MESIIAAANPSLLCEPKRSKLRFTEAKIAQRPKPQERDGSPVSFQWFAYSVNNFFYFISKCERNGFISRS